MSGYIGTQPVPQATQTRDSFTATSGQVSFSCSGYTPNFLDVFLNGIKLAAADYTATNGSDVVLASGASTGDILEVVAYSTFEVLNPTFDGNVTFTGNASFGDNDKAIFGAGSDLQIYSDGTHSYLKETGSGNLWLGGANIGLGNPTASEYFVECVNNGAVKLYHDNAAKLATTSTGIDVTGTVTSDGLTVDSNDFDISADTGSAQIKVITGSGDAGIELNAGNSQPWFIYNQTNDFKIRSDDTDYLSISTSGNVGIGTTDTTSTAQTGKLKVRNDVDYSATEFEDNATLVLQNETDNHSASIVFHSDNASNSSKRAGIVGGNINSNTSALGFYGDISNKTSATKPDVIIDSSGNVGIGTSSGLSGPSAATALRIGSQINIYEYDDGGNPVQMNINQNIDANENYIVTDQAARYQMRDGVHKWFTVGSGTAGTASGIGSAEKMRIDSSGNLLVGKIAASTGTAGCELRANGKLVGTIDGGNHTLGRLTSDGDILKFAKDNATKGSIKTLSSDNIGFISNAGNCTIGADDTGLIFSANESIRPFNPSTGASRDNAIGLGESYAKFTDVWATDGSINTSDENEKQDKASLTATEMLVGKRISGLFKTFRWIDAVAKKGDDARTHTGTMAQEVQAAFTAEGLDAGEYGMFISSTWWEHDVVVPAVEADEDVEAKDAYTRTDIYDTLEEAPEGATERTRLGIRYHELLCFVSAYNEQRFASIEARLTALEAV